MKSTEFIKARIPVSTYRLQFNKNFKFSVAKRIIPYLHDLGITDIYSSPYFKAREGSLHGYDIVDHHALNPEVGSEDEYSEMIGELHRFGMGQILDIVPNHMCIASKENAWWMDVLENGPSSRYAGFFDIDWNPVKKEIKDKVLLPVLGDQYGRVLENQEIRLAFEGGAFFIYYYDHRFPVRPGTYSYILGHRIESLKDMLGGDNPHLVELLSIITAIGHLPTYTEIEPEKVEERYREKEIIKKRLWELYRESPEVRGFIDENVRLFNGVREEPGSFDLLDGVLREQVYRLSHWRVATEEINYRRFFDINELAAIRMEEPAVFEETHRLIFSLIREGSVTGLRVDHPDGLYDPAEYFRMLQKNCYLHKRLGSAGGETDEAEIIKEYEWILSSGPQYKPFYIVGEKILIKGERMPEDWPIFSTTGYVFLNSVNGIFVDGSNAKAIDNIYSRFVRSRIDFQDIIYEKKKLIMEVAMSSEVNTLAHILNRISEEDRHTRDFTLNSLRAAIVEVIALFSVYRTYVNSGISDRDRRYIEAAVSRAKRKNPAVSESVFDFLKDVLLLNYPGHFGEEEKKEWLDFTMRFQQITGPLTAKGVDDTAFYVYNRFVSLNEVGGSPDRFGTLLETFHGQNIERSKFWPHALIATSTHDTKRSEDVRARLNVLSEIPDEWREHIVRWGRMNRKSKTTMENRPVPDRNEEYLLYQTLVGAWPFEQMDQVSYEGFKKRIKDYMLKALREAKVNSSWISPNAAYEEAILGFVERIMARTRENHFLKDVELFQKRVSWYGRFNSLSQALLKITSPGVPDFYQGSELFDLALVDPDNRRPVDYDLRIRLLEELKKRESEITNQELVRELMSGIGDDKGKTKLYLTWKALNFRRENGELFEKGEYVPLDAGGNKKEHVCAFSRRVGERSVVVAVPRFLTRLVQHGRPPLGEEVWHDSYVIIPAGSYRNVFTGEVVSTKEGDGGSVLYASELFSDLPFALVESWK